MANYTTIPSPKHLNYQYDDAIELQVRKVLEAFERADAKRHGTSCPWRASRSLLPPELLRKRGDPSPQRLRALAALKEFPHATIAEIARIAQCSETAVSNAISAAGLVKPKVSELSPEKRQLVLDVLAEYPDLSTRKITRRTGVSRAAIQKIRDQQKWGV